VAYQPEFDLTTGRLIRFEALARWNHPELGAISPTQFIPIAEESGLIIALGSQIMTRACIDARRWRDQMGSAVQVAVNVSSVQFARDSFLDEVAVILDQTGLPPSLLQIELTESVNLTGFERSSAVLRSLRGMGVSVAIDDFGTGYSCLSYLPRLPFDAVKIDRSFVNERMADSESVAFLKSIIEMAQNLRMRVIVEGIETLQELRAFAELGADEAQGNLLGRPTHQPEALFLCAPDVIGMLGGTAPKSDLQGVLFDPAALEG
jgi:EAL domain-containing protein (putative c-di-GMP-specific phosphodiesterase class I)